MQNTSEWIELIQPSANDMRQLANKWPIHPLAVEDCLNQNQRSKFEDFGDHQFMVIHAARGEQTIEFHFIIFPHALLMVADRAPVGFQNWKTFFTHAFPESDCPHLLYRVLDKILDMTEATARGFFDQLNQLEANIFSKELDPRALLALRHRVSVLAPHTAALPSVIKQWVEFSHPEGDLRWRLRDLWDHAERIRQSLDLYQLQTSTALDIYWGWTSKLANDQMERLTALAAVFMPLTFWTGFFGMNFSILPFASRSFFILGMIGMVGTVSAFYFILRKSGYFGGRRKKKTLSL